MTIKWSPTVRNARLAAIEAAMGASVRLQLWAGAEPANAAAASAGTKVAELALAADWMAAPSNGVVSLANLPLATTGLANGGVTYYRIVSSDGVTCHEQGTVTETAGGGDMIVDNATIKVGQNIQVTVFNKTEPGA